MAAAAAKLAEEAERERKREAIRARIAATKAGKAEGEAGGHAGGGQEAAVEDEKERKRCASSFSFLQQIVSIDSCLPFAPPAFKPDLRSGGPCRQRPAISMVAGAKRRWRAPGAVQRGH